MYSCKSDIFVAVKFQAISGARLKNSLAEIYSVFRPYNVAMATTTAVMKATKGIVVSEVFCESRVPLSAQKTHSLALMSTDYHAILLYRLCSCHLYNLKAQGKIIVLP